MPPLKRIAFNVWDRHRLGKHGGECVHLSVVDVGMEEPPDVLVARDEVDAKCPLPPCGVANRTYRTRSIGTS